MLLPFLLSVQAIDPIPPAPIGNIVTDPCGMPRSKDGAIVICGRRDGASPYRIEQLAPNAPALPDATFRLGNGTQLSLEGERGEIGGIPTNRATVKLKIKF